MDANMIFVFWVSFVFILYPVSLYLFIHCCDRIRRDWISIYWSWEKFRFRRDCSTVT